MTETFCWSPPAGYDLCRKILRDSNLPYVPHDYQVEGVCKTLDGIDLLAITPTGSGKTGYLSMYMLVVLAATTLSHRKIPQESLSTSHLSNQTSRTRHGIFCFS